MANFIIVCENISSINMLNYEDELFILGPEGTKLNIKAETESDFISEKVNKKGTYVVAGQRKTGSYTKITTGGVPQSKIGLTNAINCFLTTSTMKAIAGTTDKAGSADLVANLPFEIIPLKNPADLKAGDYLPIRILCDGNPYSGSFFATYAGFSEDADVFAYTARTDENGEGKLRILSPGIWLIKTDYQETYHDLNECDLRSYVTTLTFEIK